MPIVIKEVINLFKTNEGKRVFVLGIDGLGGAGKTTFVQTLIASFKAEGIKTSILHIDDFIYPKSVRYDSSKEDWECYYYLQWRYDYLLEKILVPIKLDHTIDKQIELYDKDNDNYFYQHLKLDCDTIVIIEGVFLQRNELRPFLDYVVFIDVPKEERLRRVLKRDTYIGDSKAIVAKCENRYFPAEEHYITHYNPAKKANQTIRQ